MFGWWSSWYVRWGDLDSNGLRTDGTGCSSTALSGGLAGWQCHLRRVSCRRTADLFGVATALSSGIVVPFGAGGWFMFRYGLDGDRPRPSPQAAVRESGRLDWLGPPRRSPLAAIAWKQFRESGPVVLAGLAGIVAIVIGVCVRELAQIATSRRNDRSLNVAGVTVAVWFLCHYTGGGHRRVLDATSDRDCNTFWRSRPITPTCGSGPNLSPGCWSLLVALYCRCWPLCLAVAPTHPWR